MAATYNVSSDV